MSSLVELLQSMGAFVAGLAGRAGVFLLATLLVLLPAVILALAWRGMQRRRSQEVAARAGSFAWRRGAFHAPNHTWLAQRAPGELAVGIDDLARELLPSVTAVELPRPGVIVRRGQPAAVLFAGARAIPIESPVSGMVVRPNAGVAGDPALVRREPYGAGWLFSVAPADAGYKAFPAEEGAEAWMAAEARRLAAMLETQLGVAAADGGPLPPPSPSTLGDEGWAELLRSFLHEPAPKG
ncbi:MAG: glycine cleavage system protein H [Anaeromyxobacter sp.]